MTRAGVRKRWRQGQGNGMLFGLVQCTKRSEGAHHGDMHQIASGVLSKQDLRSVHVVDQHGDELKRALGREVRCRVAERDVLVCDLGGIDTKLYLFALRFGRERGIKSAAIAADELFATVDDHLRCVHAG